MKKGFLKSKIFLLVFTIGFLPEALAQLQCKSAFISLSNLSEKFVPKEIKARLIRDLETSTRDIKTSNLEIIKHILTTYPALKNIRLTKEEAPYLFNKIKKEDRDWCPEGWGLLHLAAYFKNPALLDLLLKVGVNARTIKSVYPSRTKNLYDINANRPYIGEKRGTISFEDNALHISIKRNFEEGINIIFKHRPKEKFVEHFVWKRAHYDISKTRYPSRESKGMRFIDEISNDGKSPWLLALERDMKHEEDPNFTFTHLIGQQGPGLYYPSAPNSGGGNFGYLIAMQYNKQEYKAVSDLAIKYLKASQLHIEEFKHKIKYELGLRSLKLIL